MEYQKYLNPSIVSKISSLELKAKYIVEGFIMGLHKSPFHGFSVEFAEHRQYMPGDEIKRIDWKIYGKSNKFYVKQYEEETNLKCYIVLDSSASMGYCSNKKLPNKFEYALSLSAAFAYLMIKQQDAVGAGVYNNKLNSFLPAHSRLNYLSEIMKVLSNAKPSSGTMSSKALNLMAERIKRRGLVIVISDFLDDINESISALKHFRHKQNEVIAIQLLDPLEKSFNFDYNATFRDMETGEQMVSQPSQIKNDYQITINNFLKKFKKECSNSGIDYLLIDTSTPFDTALTEYISKRRKML